MKTSTPKQRTKKVKQPIRTNFSRAPPLYITKPTKSIYYQADVKGVEQKDITEAVTITFATTPVFTAPRLLNGCVQGVGGNQRVGRRIMIKSHMMRYAVSTVSGGSFRFLVIYDKQPNGTLPAITDVLSSTDFHAAMNLANADRFVTIFDQHINVQDFNLNTVYRKMNLETMFSGAFGNIADIASGSVFIMTATNATVATPPSLVFTTRIRFTDV